MDVKPKCKIIKLNIDSFGYKKCTKIHISSYLK